MNAVRKPVSRAAPLSECVFFRPNPSLEDAGLKGLIGFLLVVALAVPAWAGEPLKIVYFEDFRPYSWREGNRTKGMLIDILDEALSKRMGLSVVHAGYPWERAQTLVRLGQADAFSTLTTPERLGFSKASNATVCTVTFNLFTGASNPNLQDLRQASALQDLKPFRFVAYLGSGWAKKNLTGFKVQWTPTLESALLMLERNRVDAFIDISESVRYTVKTLGMSKVIKELPHCYDKLEFKLFIGDLSPYQRILPAFDRIMTEMVKDGTVKRILKSYQ